MASIFNSLNIGYSGLNAAQIGIDTTSQNIANAESEGYTRQRVITEAAEPLNGIVGNGTSVQSVERIFDNYVFDRYTGASADKAYSDYETKTLDILSTYFPEIDGVGVKSDLADYYDMWQTLADNPDNDSIKLALTQQTETLTNHIQDTQAQVETLQQQVNDELAVNVNEVNDLAKQLADLNRDIDIAEAGGEYVANDLRDKRNVIETSLAKLIGAETNSGQLESNIQIDSSTNLKTGSYSVSVGGFNIVDGSSYHPIKMTQKDNANGFYELSYERQDGTLIPMGDNLSGDSGKIGAILDLRGTNLDDTGTPTTGVIQNTIDQLDSFAAGLIESTNNLYAQTPTTKMQSNTLDVNPENSILNSGLNINAGTFDVVVYDIDGKETGRRSITIDEATVMTGVPGSNSIEGQLAKQSDDNADGNATNDIDDFITFNWSTNNDGSSGFEFLMDPLAESRGYSFSIQDGLEDNTFSSGTNFAGATGVNRFLDGTDAGSIDLNHTLKNNPTLVTSGYSSSTGDNNVALDMVQQQFENYDFEVGDVTYQTTMYGMFDVIATDVGTANNAAILKNETITTQYNAIELEYASVSKVSIDEEMTNLIKYQTSYSAAAKIITTLDEMMQTLLGMK